MSDGCFARAKGDGCRATDFGFAKSVRWDERHRNRSAGLRELCGTAQLGATRLNTVSAMQPLITAKPLLALDLSWIVGRRQDAPLPNRFHYIVPDNVLFVESMTSERPQQRMEGLRRLMKLTRRRMWVSCDVRHLVKKETVPGQTIMRAEVAHVLIDEAAPGESAFDKGNWNDRIVKSGHIIESFMQAESLKNQFFHVAFDPIGPTARSSLGSSPRLLVSCSAVVGGVPA
ncbi:MAG: hypothetical protein ACKVW3_18125, partial [Phycisphaerales bacterium]